MSPIETVLTDEVTPQKKNNCTGCLRIFWRTNSTSNFGEFGSDSAEPGHSAPTSILEYAMLLSLFNTHRI